MVCPRATSLGDQYVGANANSPSGPLCPHTVAIRPGTPTDVLRCHSELPALFLYSARHQQFGSADSMLIFSCTSSCACRSTDPVRQIQRLTAEWHSMSWSVQSQNSLMVCVLQPGEKQKRKGAFCLGMPWFSIAHG
eukprot:2768417-Amphidinium_carterae.1